MDKVLIVPGLRNSGPDHWQTWFEKRLPNARRVQQADWERTCLAEWAGRVRQEIDGADAPVWIIRGAFLVAPADPDRFRIPHVLLEENLGFPSLVVASSNDPWVKAEQAAYWAGQWGSAYLDIGAAGHINVDSGHGPWPQGLELFEAFRLEAGRWQAGSRLLESTARLYR